MAEPTTTLTLTSDHRELRFTLGAATVTRAASLPGAIDIGESGRLLGLELDLSAAPEIASQVADFDIAGSPVISLDGESLYLAIMPGQSDQARSASVTVTVWMDAEGKPVQFVIPRRGAGYEISYPSGNR